MLAVDLSIWISGVDQMDSVDLEGLGTDSVNTLESTADLISQWEAELLQEKLQELLHAATAPDTKTQVWRVNTAACELCVAELNVIHKNTDISLFLSLMQDTEQLKSLGSFLQANRDLGEKFSAELEAINSLEARE